MRKALVPEGYDKPSTKDGANGDTHKSGTCMSPQTNSTSDNNTPHNVTHYAQGKDGKHHRKTIKCPQMKYNKFQMYDLKDTPPPALTQGRSQPEGPSSSAAHSNHNSGRNGGHTDGSASPDKSPIHLSQTVEQDVKEIRRYLRTLIGRINQKEDRAKITLEWRIVALVLDRIFFYFYLTAMIVSLATIFPKTTLRM